MQTATLEVGGIQVMIIEVTGTYQVGRQMGGSGEALPDHMLLGAIAEGPDANWFFKLTGPQQTVAAAKDDFRQMIESIRAGV